MKRFTFFLTLAVVFFGMVASAQAQRTSILREIRDYIKEQRAAYRGATDVPDAISDRAEYFTQLMEDEFSFTDRQRNQVYKTNLRYFGVKYAIADVQDEFSTEYNLLMNGTGRSFERGRATYEERMAQIESDHNAGLMYFLKRDGFPRFKELKPRFLDQVVAEFGEL